MAHPHYRSQFGDTTFTKVFVGGLAWETPTDEMRRYFEQFGDILEAVVITDKNTGKSKGYGFVTFRDPESARRACDNPNPVIDGRRANCNIASLGRPRPSPPRGRNQGGNNPNYHQQGGGGGGAPSSYGGVAAPVPPPQVIYPPFGYPGYSPDYSYHQGTTVYNPQAHHHHHQQAAAAQTQYYHQVMGAAAGSPYYYGYALQSPSPRGTYSAARPQRMLAPVQAAGPGSYIYYHTHMEGTFPPPPPPPILQLPRHPFPLSASDSQTPQQSTTAETEAARAVTPASDQSPNTLDRDRSA